MLYHQQEAERLDEKIRLMSDPYSRDFSKRLTVLFLWDYFDPVHRKEDSNGAKLAEQVIAAIEESKVGSIKYVDFDHKLEWTVSLDGAASSMAKRGFMTVLSDGIAHYCYYCCSDDGTEQVPTVCSSICVLIIHFDLAIGQVQDARLYTIVQYDIRHVQWHA